MEAVAAISAILEGLKDVWSSKEFQEYLTKLAEKKPEPKPKEFAIKTVDKLSEKQAEGLTYEQIYLNLLSGAITARQATRIIEGLGEKANPHPLAWLRNKLSNIRGWINDSIKFLQSVGNELGLQVDKIEVELAITPHVTITFQAKKAVSTGSASSSLAPR